MKKSHKTILIGILGICLAGCAKDLDQKPISSVTTSNYYRNDSDFKQAVSAIYNSLNQYPDRLLNLSEIRSDNLYAISDGIREYQLINDFAVNITTASTVAEAWTANYNGIYNANTVLDALGTNGEKISDANLRSRFEAEAKFLRAFFYFDLVRWFGKVPVIDQALGPEEVFEIPRSPVADVYNLIISDLEFATQNLPGSYTGADVGRVTKYAAEGLLALVYLTRSGPTYGIEGPGLESNEYDQALDLLNDIINNGPYAFVDNYADIFAYDKENNAEVIFDVQYMSSGSTATYQTGATYPGLLVPDAWLAAVGVPYPGGGATKEASADLVNTFPAGDLRFPVAIQNGYTSNNTVDDRPFIRKYVDVEKFGASRFDWPINFIVLRYTDVLLMKAECILNGAAGSQADVDAIVNQVRARAHIPAVSNVTLAQLMEERRREFVGEGSRWHDLVREGLAITTMNEWRAVEDSTGQYINEIVPDRLIYPIPQAEIDVKPGLYTQNPGY